MKKKIFFVALIAILFANYGCKEEIMPTVSKSSATLDGNWKPVRHELRYWKQQESYSQRGYDTVIVYENDSIAGYDAKYIPIPTDTLSFNMASGLCVVNLNYWKIAKQSGLTKIKVMEDLNNVSVTGVSSDNKTSSLFVMDKGTWTENSSVVTINGTLTKSVITTITNKYAQIEITQGETFDLGIASAKALRIIATSDETTKETGKADVMKTYSKVINFTIRKETATELELGYFVQMNVVYLPPAVSGQRSRKTTRWVTNIVNYSKI